MKNFNPQHTILVDADGVLLNWEYAFAIWMEQHGFNKVPGSEFEYEIPIDEANEMMKRILEIIDCFQPKYWVIENPQTGLLKEQPFIRDLP